MPAVVCLNYSSRSFFNSNTKFSKSSLVADVSTTVLCLEEDCNTVFEKSASKKLLLNFGVDLKKLRDNSSSQPRKSLNIYF